MNETWIEKKTIDKGIAHSKVAVLGLLADLRREPTQYDLRLLHRLVKNIQPDLLCAEIHPDDWQFGDLSTVWLEYRETLLPLARRTDIIVVPVGGSARSEIKLPEDIPLVRLRRLAVQLINSLQRRFTRLARHPDDLNGGALDTFCDGRCALALWVSGSQARQAWEEVNNTILNNIITAVRRDPGRRVLVTVDCRRRRWLMGHLCELSEIELLTYHTL